MAQTGSANQGRLGLFFSNELSVSRPGSDGTGYRGRVGLDLLAECRDCDQHGVSRCPSQVVSLPSCGHMHLCEHDSDDPAREHSQHTMVLPLAGAQ